MEQAELSATIAKNRMGNASVVCTQRRLVERGSERYCLALGYDTILHDLSTYIYIATRSTPRPTQPARAPLQLL